MNKLKFIKKMDFLQARGQILEVLYLIYFFWILLNNYPNLKNHQINIIQVINPAIDQIVHQMLIILEMHLFFTSISNSNLIIRYPLSITKLNLRLYKYIISNF